MKPLVSIVVPNYNKASLLAETVASLKAQSYESFEVLFVDDASTDGSVEAFRREVGDDPRFQLFQQPQSRGGSAARNVGFRASRGSYVMFFDSDDLLAPTCLERRLRAYEQVHAEKNLLVFPMGTFKGVFDLEGAYGTWGAWKVKEPLAAILRHEIPWSVMQPLWRRDALEALVMANGQLFDEDYARLQDVELHTRALLHQDIHWQWAEATQPDCFYRIDETRSASLSWDEQTVRQMRGFMTYLDKMCGGIQASQRDTGYYLKMLRGTLFEALRTLAYRKRIKQISVDVYRAWREHLLALAGRQHLVAFRHLVYLIVFTRIYSGGG